MDSTISILHTAQLDHPLLTKERVGRGLMEHPRLGFQSLILRRRELRQKATRAEQILWKDLRSKRLGRFKFRRQHGIGPYIVDFCAPHHGLVIEIDGDIHADPGRKEKDKLRQSEIEFLGFCVVRYTNDDIFRNLEGVLEDILIHLAQTSPSPPPL